MKLSEDHIQNVCKSGKGEATCSFLGVVPGTGFSCLKGTSIEAIIFQRRATGEMKAQGNNCSGPPNFTSKDNT